MESKLIFVSIAAYKDSQLKNTIDDLYSNADNPNQIRIVVFNQTEYDKYDDHLIYDETRRVEVVSIDYRNTKGVSWIRHKIQTYIEQEKYYMQIDAHMQFEKGWDTKLINWLHQANSTKPVITFYPSGYNLEQGKYESRVIINEPRAINRKAVTSQGIGLGKEACDLHNGDNLPISSTTFAAGFTFAPIEYAKEVPYDPKLYWNYEESDQTFRAFTNGWNFFGAPECIVWHKYNTQSSAVHFKETIDMVGLENRSNDHAEKKYFSDNYNGSYPLGTVRTLEEFKILNNVDFEASTLIPKETKDMIIVVPYRDREEHLTSFFEKTPKYFDSQGISYDILVTELDPQGDWNAGLVANSVINFIKKTHYKYIYIHHVDVYPISGQWSFPEDGEIYTNLGDAGSCLTTIDNFLKVGGYRNTFWGWGAEDDDLYKRMFNASIRVLNVQTENTPFKVKYDIGFQNHNRPFVAKNYGGNIVELNKKFNRNYNSIFDTNKFGITHSLEKIKDNIYRQRIKPLKISPKDSDNKNLVLGFTYNLKPEDIYAFLKTTIVHGTGNYDVTLIDVSEEMNKEVEHELTAFGVNIVKMPPCGEKSEFTERFRYYKEYLQTTDYTDIILTDVLDVFFQGNPFKYFNDVPEDHVIFASEGITIGDSEWNRGVLGHLYPKEVIDVIKPYEVLCCGVIGGKKAALFDLIDKFLVESSKYPNLGRSIRGEDQPMIQKLIYHDQVIKRHVFRSDIPYAVHLHPIVYQPNECRFTNDVKIENNAVRTADNELYTIVHQYNRHQELYNTVVNHYRTFFEPIVKQ